MSNFQLTLRLVWIIAINLMPIVWLIKGDVKVDTLIQLYWLENVIIGAFLILKILCLPVDSGKSLFKNLFSSAFFSIHFGGFCAIHGMLLYSFFGDGSGADHISDSLHNELGPLVILEMLYRATIYTWQTFSAGFHWTVYGLIISHAIEFIQNHLANGKYKHTNANKLAKEPYRHVIIMHVALIACAIPINALGSPLLLLIALIVGKTGLDIYLVRKESQIELDKNPDKMTDS